MINTESLLRDLAALDPWQYIHDAHDSGDECFFCARRRNSGQHADYCIWARAQTLRDESAVNSGAEDAG